MNVNMKIEAKRDFNPSKIQEISNFLSHKDIIKSIYKIFSKDEFSLKYKVQKLSKKAKRNNLKNK